MNTSSSTVHTGGQTEYCKPISATTHQYDYYCNTCNAYLSSSSAGCNFTGSDVCLSVKSCNACGNIGETIQHNYVAYVSGCEQGQKCSKCGDIINQTTVHDTKIDYDGACRTYYDCTCNAMDKVDINHGSSKYTYTKLNDSSHSYVAHCIRCGDQLDSGSAGHDSCARSYSHHSHTQHAYTRYCGTCASNYDSGTESHIDSDYNYECDLCRYKFSVPVVIATVETVGCTANYKDLVGTVTATSTATDNTDYLHSDVDEFDSMTTKVTAFGTSGTDTTTNNSSKNSSISKTISASTISTSWVTGFANEKYSYNVQSDADITVDGRPDSDTTSTTGFVRLTNEDPMQSITFNGSSSLNEGNYKTAPIVIHTLYSDPENDLYRTKLIIEIQSGSSWSTVLNYTAVSGSTASVTTGGGVTTSSVTKTLGEFKATVKFPNEGVYRYTLEVEDLGSNSTLRAGIGNKLTKQGTFYISGEPEPPVAIINGETHALENVAYTITQSSTDPNRVSDIVTYVWTNAVDVTEGISESDKIKTSAITHNWDSDPRNGGTITFPIGASKHTFKVTLTVTDKTGLTSTAEKYITVLSSVPVATLKVTSGNSETQLKENRSITISAADSATPPDPGYEIKWENTKWQVTAVSGGAASSAIKIKEGNVTGGKERTLQFSKPGVYRLTVTVYNQFSINNSSHKDISAATTEMLITVLEDTPPISSVSAISDTALTAGINNYTVRFRVQSSSDDNDIITAGTSYVWELYADTNGDGEFSSDEQIKTNITYNASKTEIQAVVPFYRWHYNKVRAVVTTSETFGQPTETSLLASDGSYKRSTTVETVLDLNMAPTITINPVNTTATPYEQVDIDGNGTMDGTYIRAYTDDTFTVNAEILDESASTSNVTWTVYKLGHNGTYSAKDPAGRAWLSSGLVTSTLGHDGGTLNINYPGIYKLHVVVEDDLGVRDAHYVMIRVYTLPKAVLSADPDYLIDLNNQWYTKENIRYDITSYNSIVDDEWGVAWHQMDWSKDCWDVTPLDGQDIKDIHSGIQIFSFYHSSHLQIQRLQDP